MSKPLAAHAHGQNRFSWRAFFFGVMVILIPLLALLPIAGIALIVGTTREVQVRDARQMNQLRQLESANIALDRAQKATAQAQLAARAAEDMGMSYQSEMGMGAGMGPGIGSARGSGMGSGMGLSMSEGGMDDSGDAMGAEDVELAPSFKPNGLYGGEDATHLQIDRVSQLLAKLVQQQEQQARLLEQQVDANQELLRVLRDSLKEKEAGGYEEKAAPAGGLGSDSQPEEERGEEGGEASSLESAAGTESIKPGLEN